MASRTGPELVTAVKAATPIKLLWGLNADEIAALSESVISQSRAVYDKVAASRGSVSFATTIAPLIENDYDFHVVESTCTFPQHVSALKEVRDASTKSDEILSEFSVEMGSRVDLYEAIKEFADTKPSLTAEQQRYVDRLLREFRRKGLHLEESVRNRVLSINKRLSELGIVYSKNLNEENTKFEFSAEQLKGVPADFLAGLTKSENSELYTVTLKYPHYLPIMKLCSVDETRRVLEKAFNQRCMTENTLLLEEMVTLRHEKARLLGYPTHAAFVVDVRMAKTPEAIDKFLKDLSARLTPLADAETKVLLQLKETEKKNKGEPFDGVINAWDVAYYRNKVEEEHYKVNHQLLKPYFPLAKVLSGMLDIYQRLLGLKFTDKTGQLPTWHEDVLTFQVDDAASGRLVGYFHLDLHPRDGKYGHAACFGLQPSVALLQGGRMVPVAACVCNFSKPTPGKPSLLEHDEVETFFHEFGHCCHQLCSLAELGLFAGTNVERDFVEAPSQMLENWVWEKESLTLMSGHYETGEPLPDDLMTTLINARNANAGLINKRQVVLATFDQTIHTREKADTAALLAQLTKEILGYEMTPGTNMAASFGHLAGGYDAQYYGYLWSEVFSMDMFQSRFAKEGILNPAVGRDYRNFILAPGGSVDAADMIRNFLGRDPTADAFLRSKGLAV